jgi:hypothetical protein
MKLGDVARDLLAYPSYSNVTVDVDGWELRVIDVMTDRPHEVCIVAEWPDPEQYDIAVEFLPAEATDKMIEKAATFGIYPAVLRLLWATMVNAYRTENE